MNHKNSDITLQVYFPSLPEIERMFLLMMVKNSRAQMRLVMVSEVTSLSCGLKPVALSDSIPPIHLPGNLHGPRWWSPQSRKAGIQGRLCLEIEIENSALKGRRIFEVNLFWKINKGKVSGRVI